MFIADHPHAKLLSRLYDSEIAGAMELLEGFVDPDFVCHGSGKGLVGEKCVGWPAFKAHAAEMARISAGTMGHRTLAIFANDIWGFVPQVMTASRPGGSLDLAVSGVWRFSAVERIAEHWELVSDVAKWDDFWNL